MAAVRVYFTPGFLSGGGFSTYNFAYGHFNSSVANSYENITIRLSKTSALNLINLSKFRARLFLAFKNVLALFCFADNISASLTTLFSRPRGVLRICGSAEQISCFSAKDRPLTEPAQRNGAPESSSSGVLEPSRCTFLCGKSFT
jgi:hypothetical protein